MRSPGGLSKELTLLRGSPADQGQEQLSFGPAAAANSSNSGYLTPVPLKGWPSTKTLEKAMAPHSSTLAWKIPWVEEPGGLQSMGSLRVGHD